MLSQCDKFNFFEKVPLGHISKVLKPLQNANQRLMWVPQAVKCLGILSLPSSQEKQGHIFVCIGNIYNDY